MSGLCTYAATGSTPAFQAIYVCHTCSTSTTKSDGLKVEPGAENEVLASNADSTMPLCICQHCAEECHEAFDHDVEYIAMGLGYCDCITMKKCSNTGCKLEAISTKTAKDMGIVDCQSQNSFSDINVGGGINYTLKTRENNTCNDFKFEYKVFTIPDITLKTTSDCEGNDGFHSMNLHKTFMQEALELVKHTTDTHWVPFDYSNNHMCGLEQFALSIFQNHVQRFQLQDLVNLGKAGAEWWVQVKTLDPNVNSTFLSTKLDGSKGQAIDLHYDKDEELASAFGLGSFPTLSTVTYLTDYRTSATDSGTTNPTVAPTLVFPHTYDMPGEGPVGGLIDCDGDDITSSTPQLLICHPIVGKHLVFDGRLLHGVPSNLNLRQSYHKVNNDDSTTLQNIQNDEKLFPNLCKGLRVTFLVNIWISKRPSKVSILPSSIREKMLANADSVRDYNHTSIPLSFEDITGNVPKLYVVSKNCDEEVHRLKLPFVSSGALWIDDDDESIDNNTDNPHDDDVDDGLFVTLVSPPPYEDDTILLVYDSDLVPCLERFDNQNDESDYSQEDE